MADYLHGAYGHLGESIVTPAVSSATVPVYIGTAPVGLVRGWESAVNAPIEIGSLAEAREKIGYSDDFARYTLCEAVHAHFNGEGVGPIYVINVLDPSAHKKEPETEADVVFSKGRCAVECAEAVLDTLAVKDAEGSAVYVEGEDYTVSAVDGGFTVYAVDGGGISDGPAKISYRETDPDAVDGTDVAGAVTEDGEYSGVHALPLVYQELFAVPNIVAAPGWSHLPEVYEALVECSEKINGHWDAVVVVDIPLVGTDAQAVDTIDKAVAWKAEHGYDSERAVACWPMALGTDGERMHVSTLFTASSQRVDQGHDGVPFESPSNKAVPVERQFFGDNSKNRGFDQQKANALNAKGITTVVGWAGQWVLWGPHTAAYDFDGSNDPRAVFASNMRMLLHITNLFQIEWSPEIDGPMTRALKDRIVNREQEKLDGYVTVGALIGQPRVTFEETENPVSDLVNGDFRWDISATPTPPLKSATVYVSYTDAGFAAYFGGGE